MIELFASIRDSRRFQGFILVIIGIAAVLVGLETYPEIVAQHGELLHVLDAIILGIFVIEILIKLASFGSRPGRFFADGWNVFDFVIVAVCFLPGNAHFAAVLRLASCALRHDDHTSPVPIQRRRARAGRLGRQGQEQARRPVQEPQVASRSSRSGAPDGRQR